MFLFHSGITALVIFLCQRGSSKDTCFSDSNHLSQCGKSDKTDVANEVYEFFKDKAFSKNAICGMLGNMEWESRLNPEAGEIGGGGYGLVQWSGESLKDFKKWAKDNDDLDIKKTNTQCQRILYEYKGGYKQWYIKENYCSLTFSDYAVSTKSPEELAACFMYNYERPSSTCSHLEDRKNYAREWYNHFD